jgi:DNA polymerase-3 subunit gamma/tau
VDVTPANPVRSERKQPQWAFYGSSSLPLADCKDRSSTMSQAAPQAYRVLARKYRPETFAALIGQDALVRTLSNALAMKRLAHAFVLTGVRGVGKTSTARLLAKGLNCIGEDGTGAETLEPCGKCEPCTAISAGRHVDVLEIDAASHTGVDDAREIIEGVGYRPVSARYKIYIIDEVHMMSKSAFNALLKTLEEPPESVKFIFATTEIRKVPVTILSRCQRYDLRRVSADMLEQHLRQICAAENINSDDGALRAIAIAAEGSVRDALSMLDQAAAMTSDDLKEDAVDDMLGRPGRKESMAILSDALAGNVAQALAGFTRVHTNGAEPEMVVADLLNIIHQASLVAAGAGVDDLGEAERDNVAALGELGIARLGRAWQLMLKGHEEVRQAPNPVAALEMLLIRLAHAANMPTPGDILQKLPQASKAPSTPAEPAQRPQSSAPEPTLESAPESGPASTVAGPSVAGNVTEADNTPPKMHLASGGSQAVASEMPAASQPETQPDIQPATAPDIETKSTVVEVNSLADIAALAEDRDEVLLAARIRTHLRLVAMQPGSLEVALAEKAPDALVGDVARYLTQWTGRRWLVSVSDGPGGKTLAEERAEEAAELKNAISEAPIVKSVMALFPGATIESIKPRIEIDGDALPPAAHDEETEQ